MTALPTPEEAVRVLVDLDRRVRPSDLQELIGTTEPGLYAWWVDVAGAAQIAAGLGSVVQPGLIYAGQAGASRSTATLGSRIRGNHLGVSIYASTLRLTLAAVLRTPLALEPVGGRRMTRDGEVRLTAWMRQHLEVSAVAYPDRVELDACETAVLDLLDPPLNLAKRPRTSARQLLSHLRRVYTGAPARRPAAERT